MEEPRLLVSRSIGKKIVLLFSPRYRGRTTLLHASENPFISIFNCRCAVYSVT